MNIKIDNNIQDLSLLIKLLEMTKKVLASNEPAIIDFSFENKDLSICITPKDKTKDEYISELQRKIQSLTLQLDSQSTKEMRWVDCDKDLPYLMDNYLVLMKKPNHEKLIPIYARYHPKDRVFGSNIEFADGSDIEDCKAIKWLDERKRQNGVKTDFEDWNEKFRY